ncbi:MAG TPA: FAD-dependent oxidoreductase [Streptosporangiaceae bacterium]|nr:FAD-dependent oxidoreductase [Streptosporangiaceae bacterium]
MANTGGAERIVIVGASLAGLRAAEALRQHGFSGTLTIIGEEDAPPYDRPPLSKQVLTGWIPAGHAELARLGPLDGVRWQLGTPAAGLDRDAKEVVLADGSRVPYDKVLIATGVRNRPWPQADEAALDGVCGVRTQADAARLAGLLDAGPRRVVVIGAGFTGSEIASACRHRGIDVTVVERGEAPLAAALGGVVGDIAARLHRDNGVDLRCDVTVTGLHGSGGRLAGAALSDGSEVPAEVAVIALGAVRNTEWLAGSGLAAGPLGVSADAGCRAIDVGGLVTDDVFVAGDVARFAHALFGYQYLALEHWENAVVGARVAAHNMICPTARRRPHACVPTFWSVQFDVNIKSAGVPALAEEIIMTHGSPEDASFAAAYGDADGRIVAAVTFNHGRYLDYYRRLIEQAAPLPDPVGEGLPGKPEPARFPHPAGSYHGPSVIVTGHSPTEMTAVAVPAGRSAR